MNSIASQNFVADIDAGKLLEGFFGIVRNWRLSREDTIRLLGAPSEKTYYNWRDKAVRKLPRDTIERIGWIAGIYKALQILYSNPAQADQWIRRPNRYFGGQTPLERMRAGSIVDLAAVREYLDAARSPW